MNNIPQIKRKPMEAVHLRLPPEIREEARKLATAQSSSGLKVKEADVYRWIIEIFFSKLDT